MEINVSSTYTPARQRALKKYYEANRESLLTKMTERNRKHYQMKKDTDEWKAKKKEYNRAYYLRKQMLRQHYDSSAASMLTPGT